MSNRGTERLPAGVIETLEAARERDSVAGLGIAEGGAASAGRKSGFKAADRLTGLLLGCAIGDALGMPVSSFSDDNDATLRALHRLGGVRDFLAPQGHVHRALQRLRAGCWTDETQLTLATARALMQQRRLSYEGIASAYVQAFKTLELRGWDPTTKQACRRLEQGTPYTHSGKRGGHTNTVIGRIAPIAGWSYCRGESDRELFAHCRAVALMTQQDSRPVVGAYLIALLVRDGLASSRRWEPSADRYFELIEEAKWAESVLAAGVGASEYPLSQHLAELSDALEDSDPSELAELSHGATGDICASVPFLVAMLCSRSWEFEEGVIATVNVGGATDTNAAAVGAILGATYGVRKLPRRFIDKVEEAEMIRELGHQWAGIAMQGTAS